MTRASWPRKGYAAVWLAFLLAAGTVYAAHGAHGRSVLRACDVGPLIEAGWAAYRAGEIAIAGTRFEEALRRCPHEPGALNGAGYVALRQGHVAEARDRFDGVLAVAPDDIDALLGAGMVAWRQDRLAEATAHFRLAAQLDPGNETASDYLGRLPGEAGPPPDRPPLVRSDTTLYPARAGNGVFEIRTADGWTPIHVNGVNLGAALPGRHPSEFPDSAVYAEWIVQMAEMGANSVRTYTIHPPSFYLALHGYNSAHPDAPLWLVHGVWAELPPEDDFADPEWEGEFFQEMEYVVDLLHGSADIPYRPGHASGYYTADVSLWVLAYIIGREWEPYAVVGFNALRSELTSFSGRYLVVEHGTPMDVWLVRACEHMIAYEMDRYNAQRPMAYANWPTLDPMAHVTETTVAEEVRMRAALGERVTAEPLEYDNDAASLDATLVRPTGLLPAGWFASYHAYPYYPDYMILDPEYNRAASRWGPSNYYGYLQNLKQHHGDVPVVISEYGVPTSIGIAHIQPQGWHHGGLTEQEMAEINARMTREIAASGMAGGIIFAWIDEWFKKNWIAIEFEIPLDRSRLWFNRLDAEQHYGMIAHDALAPVAGATLEARIPGWAEKPALYTLPADGSVRVAHDEAYLWLLYHSGTAPLPDTVYFGFDMVLPERGERSWPEPGSPAVPVGIEFALRVAADGAELVVQSSYNPFQVAGPATPLAGSPVDPPLPAVPPPGTFTGRWQQQFGRPFVPGVAGAGWEQLLVVPNRRRFARDSTEFAAIGYNRGLLREGNAPDGLWQRDPGRGVLEVRVPWAMLNVTDPSERRVLLDDPASDHRHEFGTVLVEDIGIVGASVSAGTWQSWPAADALPSVGRYGWPAWEEPRWNTRIRATYGAMRTAFQDASLLAREWYR